jgi:hypothetical protein
MKATIKQLLSQLANQRTATCSVFLLFCTGLFCVQIYGQASGVQPATKAAQSLAVKSPTPKPPAFQEVSESANSKQPDSDSQGIKVHGHWVIDVRNPDGTLATHREFENSLTGASQGQLLLGGLLSGYYVAGGYAIELGSNLCAAPGNNCDIVTSEATQPGQYLCSNSDCDPSLQITYNLAPTAGGQVDAYMLMTGTVRAHFSGMLDKVSTVYNICDGNQVAPGGSAPVLPTSPSSLAPSACFGTLNSSYISTFTSTAVSPAISITALQYITVQVTISFS